MSELANRHAGTTDCVTCERYVALVARPEGGPLLTYDYERDGYTVSEQRHVCGTWRLAEVVERGEQQ